MIRRIKVPQLFDCDYFLVRFIEDDELLIVTGDKIDVDQDPANLVTQSEIMVEWPNDHNFYKAVLLAIGSKDVMLKVKEKEERILLKKGKDPKGGKGGKDVIPKIKDTLKSAAETTTPKGKKHVGKKGKLPVKRKEGSKTKKIDVKQQKKSKEEKRELLLEKKQVELQALKCQAKTMSFALNKKANDNSRASSDEDSEEGDENPADKDHTEIQLSYEEKANNARKPSQSKNQLDPIDPDYDVDDESDNDDDDEDDDGDVGDDGDEEDDDDDQGEEDGFQSTKKSASKARTNQLIAKKRIHENDGENQEDLPVVPKKKKVLLNTLCDGLNCPYKNQLEALKLKLARVTNEQKGEGSYHITAGVYSPDFARKHKMVELVPGSCVFITCNQLQGVLSGVKSRSRIATRLLRCFYTADELKMFTSYTAVDDQIKDAIEGCAIGIKKEEVINLPQMTKSKIKKALSNHVVELLRKKKKTPKRKKNE